MSTKRNATLSVAGADLYYEVRGSGPVLLMIHGGSGDADVFSGVADKLAYRYTVITYDRRGHSRSRLVHTDEVYQIKTHSDDASRLLDELTDDPVYVFGSSSGAVVAIDLAIRHPEKVRALIPHEPPLLQLLFGDEQKRARTIMEDLQVNYRQEGPFLAMKKFTEAALGADIGNQAHQPTNEQAERMMGNIKYFLEHEAPGIKEYTLDIEALKTVFEHTSVRILSAGGRDSHDTFPYDCALGLAEQLELGVVEFPGNHVGYAVYPGEFADRLENMLGN